MPIPKWQEKANEVNAEADVKADSFLDKLKGSPWTGAILLAIAASIIVILIATF